MQTQWSRWRAFALLVLSAACGCNSTRPHALSASGELAPASPAGPLRTPNLSQEQAAKLSFEAASEMARNGYSAQAIQQYEKARQLDPKLTEAGHLIAVLYDREGDFVRAGAEYKKSVEARPKDPDVLNDMGYFCYEQDDWHGAETWLRKAIAVAPGHQHAWVNLGMTLAQQGRLNESFEAFAKVVSPAEARANLGMILAQRGKVEEARQAFQQALALEPNARIPQAALAALEKRAPARDGGSPLAGRLSAN